MRIVNPPHLKDIPVENILVSNLNLEFEGGEKTKDSFRKIPEEEQRYPNGKIFGVLPAYGLYIRHAENLILSDIQLRFTSEDERPSIFCEDIRMLKITGLLAAASLNSPQQIQLINATDAIISQCSPKDPVSVFLSVKGEDSRRIVLINNRLKNAQFNLVLEEGLANTTVTEIGTIKY